MRFTLRSIVFSWVLCSAVVTLGCSGQSSLLSSTQNVSTAEDSLASLQRDLVALTADKRCDASYQCKVVSYGARACGGPSGYVVYSTKTTDNDKVMQLTDAYTQAEQRFNETNAVISICQHLMPPQSLCSEQQCVEVTSLNQLSQ